MAEAEKKEPQIAAPPIENAEDVFAAAFRALADDGPQIGDTPPDPVVEGAVAAQTQREGEAAAEGDQTPAEDDAGLPDPAQVAADQQKAKEPPKAAEPPKAQPPKAGDQAELSNEQLLEQFRQIAAQRQEPAAAAAPQPEQPPAVVTLTPEQQKVVDDYRKEFPDIYAAEQLIRMQEYQGLVAHIFSQLEPVLRTIGATTQEVAQRSHLEQLHARVPDYGEVVPKVQAWIKEQPAYLQKAYNAVAQSGTIDDVVDLINRYRTSAGEAAPQPAAPQQRQQPPTAQAKPPVPRAAVKGLAPVASKRTGVQTDVISPDDFDGAFSAFAQAD